MVTGPPRSVAKIGYQIVPTIITDTQSELDVLLARLEGKVDRVMLDIMDGRFVANTSLNFDFQMPSSFEYEAHLMVENPSEHLEALVDRVDWAILHIETLENPESEIQHFKDNGFKVSLAANPGTPLEEVLLPLDVLDGILVLTVNPGRHGAEFKPEALEKVRRLRGLGVTLPIEVDGGVNPGTILEMKNAGANVFACGSYLMKFDDVAKGIQALREALGN
jgi:ribulose-phosphate 3-epimerase